MGKTQQQNQTTQYNTDYSPCIKKKIKAFIGRLSGTSLPIRIIQFTSQGEKFYLFDEGMMVDAPAYVLNAQCDTICIMGGRRMVQPEESACPPEDNNSRRIIWPDNLDRK